MFQAPTGTRDFYPAELNRLRYVQEAWRKTSINHGFEEIDGPTFEHLELYTVKSGEGIVSELFSFERFGGEKTFALRPEFTPTLARMYAAKAASLPKPTKWFWMQNCYRAERPQRGRLREFCQWNCDIIGGESNEPEARARVDAEVIACAIAMFQSLGLGPQDVRVRVNDRNLIAGLLRATNVGADNLYGAMGLLDRRAKMNPTAWQEEAIKMDWAWAEFDEQCRFLQEVFRTGASSLESGSAGMQDLKSYYAEFQNVRVIQAELAKSGLSEWMEFDPSIARGLAYYTGMVFEVHEASGAERAIAGGGRYDKLIEMFGGPSTPAVGFGMGDVVLSLVLQDKGLLPKDEEMGEKLGLNPDALVISNGTPEADAAVAGVVATLRRAGLHARRSYKTTKNIGKLIQDAAKMRARFCVILESGTTAKIKDMKTQVQSPEAFGIEEISERVRR